MSHLHIQVFRPINPVEIDRWLQENPRIEVKGFSVGAGSDTASEPGALSVCAILYSVPTAPAGVGTAAATEADSLIESVVEEAPPPRSIPVSDQNRRSVTPESG
jgi:hypothetical protein